MAADGTIIIETILKVADSLTVTNKITSAFKKMGNIIKGVGKTLVTAFIGGSIINSIRNILSNFDLLGSSIGSKIKPLSDAFTVLKGTFVNFIATALVPMIPFLTMAVQWLTRMLTTATQIVAALFGVRKTTGSIATETRKAAKEARGALAAFDQINVLQQETADQADTAPMITPPPVEVTDEIFDEVQKIKQWFIDLWTGIKEGATKSWNWIKTTFGPMAEWVKTNIIDPIVNWIKENPEKFKTFAIILGIVVIALLLFVATLGLISIPVLIVIAAIGLLIVILLNLWIWWNVLQEQAPRVWKIIVNTWDNAVLRFHEITEKLKADFNLALFSIESIFVNIFLSIYTFVKGILNGIIGLINGMIAGLTNGINTVVAGANAIGGFFGIPALGPVSAPQIPRLATGAVIPPNAEFAAILGDQKSGRNIEAPEALLRQIVREEMGNIRADIEIKFTGSLAELVRQLKPAIDKENVRVGNKLVTGGATV